MLVDTNGQPIHYKEPAVPKAEDLLKPSPTTNYDPAAGYHSGFYTLSNRPPFSASTVQQMLTDPRIVYGLWLLKGPLRTNAHVKVDCLDENIRQYVVNQINRFWMNGSMRALKAIEWGYSGSEVVYREIDGKVQFDTLKDFFPPDVRLKTLNGKPCGIVVRNVRGANQPIFLGFPKAMYHIHWRDRNPWYGLSRLHGAHIPWWETWSDGGYRDIRRLWFYKNAYEGGTIRHPPGSTRTEQGQLIANKDLAREMVDKKRTGGTLTLPNTPGGEQGTFAWMYEPPQANAAPDGLLEYGEVLRNEVLEAMGIPPEVIQSSGDSGFGSSTGRQVPQMAFYSILQELFEWLLTDFMDYVVNPLLAIVFGPGHAEATLLPFKLSEDLSSGGAPGDPGMEQGTGEFGSVGGKGNYNGNQFQDADQRSVFMASPTTPVAGKVAHFRHKGQWWTKTEAGVVVPMSTAV